MRSIGVSVFVLGVAAGCGTAPMVGTCPDGMVLVPGGRFVYGDRDINDRRSREDVTAFCIDRYEFPNTEGMRPQVDVTWMEAASKCQAQGKRLCTEYEWEKACRGRSGLRYSWGRAFLQEACPVSEDYVSGANDQCVTKLGVADMSGSVWEWTANAWHGDPDSRVLRGGWDADVGQDSARCSYRREMNAGGRDPRVGFRCCATPTVVPLSIPKSDL